MRNLLVRLIGENIELKFHLDPSLGLVKMDPAQCQQILLNLVLNARDAVVRNDPGGGQITVETSNCKVQILTEQVPPESAQRHRGPGLAAVRAVRGGRQRQRHGRRHAHPSVRGFLYHQDAGKGTGLGLATVYDIVTGNGGLIHVESAPGCGTRVSVLLPLVPEAVLDSARRILQRTLDDRPSRILTTKMG